MRHLTALIIALLFVALFFAVRPRSVRSQGAVILSEKPDVKVSLAVVEGGRQSAASAFRVIIENISDKPQSHFDEWNSWGYYNLSLQWTNADGKTGTVAKVPRGWDQNGPNVTILQPGEALVREVSFDPKLWQGWPVGTGSITLTLKVTYNSTGEPKILNSATGWTGMVVSKEQTVVILRPIAP
jgi:hypothetical protein